MKKLKTFCKLGISILFVLGLAQHTALAQVSVAATAGTASGSYTTLNAVFTAINAGTHQGEVTITITANTTEPATPIPLLRSGTGSSSFSRIVIKPSGDRIINSATTPVTNRSVIELVGADNVTIDGDDPATPGVRNLTIQCASSTLAGVGAIRLASNSTAGADGADNDTVMNCILIGPRSSATATTINYGICFSTGTTATTTGAYKNQNAVIMNNEIKKFYYGLFLTGASSTYPNIGTKVLNNIIGTDVTADNIYGRGIYMSYSSSNTSSSSDNAEISGNDIRVGSYTTTGYSLTISGIELTSYTAGTKILNNNIHDINQPLNSTSYGAYGISIISSAHTNGIVIANNFIRNISNAGAQTAIPTTGMAAGIYITSGGTDFELKHNTIVMGSQTNTSTTKSSACITMGSTVKFSKILNNIFINLHSSSNAYGIYSTAITNFNDGNVNNNNYYLSYASAKVGFYNSLARASLLAWQLGALKDNLSVNENTTFTSATDLHIPAGTFSLCESGGATTTITGTTKDYDNETRPGTSTYGFGTRPDIGADEFNGRVNYTCTTPAPGNTSITPSSICLGESVKLYLSSTVGGTGITYQWQSSNDGTTYTDIPGAVFSEWILTPTTYTYYKCKVTCVNGPTTTTSTPLQITYNNNVVTTTGAQRCGSGRVTLAATGSAGTTLRWYDAATSGTLLGTGGSLLTPTIGGTTDFYVDAGIATTETRNTNHTGKTTWEYGEPVSPFSGYYLSCRTQYVILASDLQKTGFIAGNFNSIGLFVLSNYTSDYYENFTIKMAQTSATDLSGGFLSPSFTTVWGATDYYVNSGDNTFTFSSGFTWDGTSNIVVQMCFDNTSSYYPWEAYVRSINMPYQASYQSFSDYDDQCSVGYGDYEYGDYYIPDFTFNGVTVCAGPRKAVTATVNPLPATNISPATGPVAVCNLDAKTFTTTSVGNLQWRNASGPISGATLVAIAQAQQAATV